MAKRDPKKTEKNKLINELSLQIKELVPKVLSLTGYRGEQSLNATYGSKYADYIDIKNEIIDTPQQFRTLYFQGFHKALEELRFYARRGNPRYQAFLNYRDHEIVREWLHLFLERTFLRNYDSLAKARPRVDESIMWIGQENASYGILITPRFKNGQWENDKSEIRHFKPRYWSIGHILEAGFVIPFENEKVEFCDINQYLSFFKNTLVRNSGSIHESEIAKRYCEFVKSSEDPLSIPLLIPEFRYDGIEKKHKYRLDYTIINPFNLSKVGFELSPWATHGQLTGTKNKLQKEINEEAKNNFEKEMKKLKSYFRRYGIPILVFTDCDFQDYDQLFNENFVEHLCVHKPQKQLEFQVINDLINFKPSI